MKNIELKTILIDRENNNVFFFKTMPNIDKTFCEFSTDEDIFEQYKSYPLNETPSLVSWSEVTKEDLPFIIVTCDKYLDRYINSTPYTFLQDSMLMSFNVLFDALWEEVMKK